MENPRYFLLRSKSTLHFESLSKQRKLQRDENCLCAEPTPKHVTDDESLRSLASLTCASDENKGSRPQSPKIFNEEQSQ